jgi:3-oxoacyl-[acyl-carrier protein] reductase
MSQRIILITGANGSLGLATTRTFLAESPDNVVWLGVHHHRESAEQLAAANPGRCRMVSLDVTRPESWQTAVQEILAAHQRLDVLVNNAGMHDDAFLGQMKPESWREILAVNLDGVFHGCRAVLPTMISQRAGRIINIASLSALLAPAGQTNYAAAKAGVVALTQSLAKEVARIGITVNSVCPGFLETEIMTGMDETARQRALAQVPMRRFGRPEEVAAAVRFLACAEAGYITGSALKIDGGIL